MRHYNVQINIQRVEQADPSRGVLGHQVRAEREIVELLRLAITADTEREAYAKAHRMLSANEPNEDVALGLADDSVTSLPR